MINTHKQHARTIITLISFKHAIFQQHCIIYGGRHLGKHARDTLQGFHVISRNILRNFLFRALRAASSERFCETREITASPNARVGDECVSVFQLYQKKMKFTKIVKLHETELIASKLLIEYRYQRESFSTISYRHQFGVLHQIFRKISREFFETMV